MNGENNRESDATHGRRSTDNTQGENCMPSSYSNLRSRLFAGFIALGGVTALLGIGRASHVLDTAVNINIKQDIKIEKIWDKMAKDDIEQNRILVFLEVQAIQNKNTVKQQVDSDKKFLEVITPIKEQLKNIDNGVRQNRDRIMFINSKSTAVDNTNVICLR